MASDARLVAAFDTVRQQAAGRAAGLSAAALERLGAGSATILLRIEGNKVTYCIGGPKLAWDECVVLGTIDAGRLGE